MACSFEPGRWWKKQSLRVVEHYSLGKMQRFLKPHHLLTKWPAQAPAWLTAHHVHCVHHSAHSQHHRQYQFRSWHTWMEGALLSVLARSLEKECWPVPLFAHGMRFIYSLTGLPLLPPSPDYLLQVCQVWSLSLRGFGMHKSIYNSIFLWLRVVI